MPQPGHDAATHFALPPDRVWLNTSHQGALPQVAADAVAEMVAWKMAPHHLQTPAAFTGVEHRLRSQLAELLRADTEEIVLANSASYGLHLVANGLGLAAGDEVIVAANDYPSDILPWLRLRDAGVVVKQLTPHDAVLTAQEIAAAITPRTRAVCLTWVHSFSGRRVDLDAIGEVCRSADALFVVNGSQGIGAIPLAVHDHPIDVVTSVGFKWLTGPYGTGLCWLGPRAQERVQPTKLYWKSSLTIDDLAAPELDLEAAIVRAKAKGASRHDVFGTSNFFNFAALSASVQLILDVGVAAIHRHNIALADQLCAGVDGQHWELAPRGDPAFPTGVIFLRPRTAGLAEVGQRLADDRIDVALRSGHVRVTPHFYNTADEINRAVASFNR